MSTGFKTTIVSTLSCLLICFASAQAESKPADSLEAVTAVSDSTLALVARIISQQDTALVNAVFVEDVGLVMPGNKTLTGRAMVKKYIPLLLSKAGGGMLTTSRLKIEPLADYADRVREAGLFTLTREVEDGDDYRQTGAYTIYWKFGDDGWFIERGFIGQK